MTISDSTPGATIYYTTNGTTRTTSSSVYSGPIAVSCTETIEAIAAASGYSSSSVASATYTINTTPATPTFSLAPGTYTSTQTVSISDGTPGATIYYTTNGTTPTTSSTEYTGAITVSSTEIVEAVATVGDPTMSAVASATYVIEPPNISYPRGGFQASSFDLNGGAAITSGGLLQLTDGGGSESRSAWFATKVQCRPSQRTSTFQLVRMRRRTGSHLSSKMPDPTQLAVLAAGWDTWVFRIASPSSSTSTTTRAKDRTRPDSILTAPRPWFLPSTSLARPSTSIAAIPSQPTSPTMERPDSYPDRLQHPGNMVLFLADRHSRHGGWNYRVRRIHRRHRRAHGDPKYYFLDAYLPMLSTPNYPAGFDGAGLRLKRRDLFWYCSAAH